MEIFSYIQELPPKGDNLPKILFLSSFLNFACIWNTFYLQQFLFNSISPQYFIVWFQNPFLFFCSPFLWYIATHVFTVYFKEEIYIPVQVIHLALMPCGFTVTTANFNNKAEITSFDLQSFLQHKEQTLGQAYHF